jgi:transcriptional regulator with XRE-family HTH domain
MGGNRNAGLGEFLRSRRAALSPDGTGVPNVGSSRRVPGLRREEVALLAGVSVHYYTRLEQGEGHQMSDSVAEAIARALRLDESERLHLQRLAWPSHLQRPEAGPEQVRDSLLAMAESCTDLVAFVIGRRLDFLGGNQLARALYGLDDDDQQFNLARHTFLDPAARDLHLDWAGFAREVAAYLRMATSNTPDDPGLAELIGELTIKSPDFVRIWSEHPVRECTSEIRQYNHPRVGLLILKDESLRVPDDPGQRINFMTAEPGTESAERLRRLAPAVAAGTGYPERVGG